MVSGCYNLLNVSHLCQEKLKDLLLFDLKRRLEHAKPKEHTSNIQMVTAWLETFSIFFIS